MNEQSEGLTEMVEAGRRKCESKLKGVGPTSSSASQITAYTVPYLLCFRPVKSPHEPYLQIQVNKSKEDGETEAYRKNMACK